jgi:hypothetical protein
MAMDASAADLQLEIGNFEREIHDGLSPTTRPFIGTFRFRDVPRPLQPTVVDYEFEVAWDERWPVEEDWDLKVRFYRGRIRLLSDSIIVWPGPHKLGDVLRGTLEFVPMASGILSINIHQQPENWRTRSINYIAAGLTFSFGLDQDGSVLYVGPQASSEKHYSVPEVFFFEGDTLWMPGVPDPGPLFRDEVFVTPPFGSGDTSTIRVKLTALKPIRSEMDIHLETVGLKLIRLPEPLDNPIGEGDVIELELTVILLRGPDKLGLHMQFMPSSKGRDNTSDNRQSVYYKFILNENGGVRYAQSRRFAESKLIGNSKRNSEVVGNPRSTVVIYGSGESPYWLSRAVQYLPKQ